MINNKVFFIISNQSKLDNDIKYYINDKNGIINLKTELTKKERFNNEDYTITVFSFEIIKKYLREKDKDKDTKSKKYQAKIYLHFNKMNFERTILFNKNRNNFIYDFEISEYKCWTGIYSPPLQIKFSKNEQLKIYTETLNKIKIEENDSLLLNLISDSQTYIIGQKFYFDFYLNILKQCYKIREIKTLLKMFKFERILIPEKMDINDYSDLLKKIENDPNEFIGKHFSEKYNKEKLYQLFYSILLYFRVNYEKEKDKVQSLLLNKDLWKYYIELLPNNYKYFPNIEVPNELIIEMLKQKSITFLKIKGALSFVNSLEKILSIINNNIDIIFEFCIKEEQKINILEYIEPNENDDLKLIIYEMEKLIKYELNKGENFILFEKEFWINYIHFNDKNLNNLILINKAIQLYIKIDKNLNYDKLEIKFKIHITGLEMIKKGELKNEEFLNFIENEDIYFIDKNYEGKGFRPIAVLKGIDLEIADEKFFERWEKSIIFKIFAFNDYEFKKQLIDKINDMKDFGKLLKLFNYKDKNIFDNNSIELIREKFKNLIKTYEIEKCPNFIKDISLFIYMNDQNNIGITKLMENTIEKYIKSNQTIIDIYLNLACNYNDISKELIEYITNYFIKNEDSKIFLLLLEKLNNKDMVIFIINKMNSFIIKQEDILSQEKEIDSFKLLEVIQKLNLLDKFPEINDTNYLLETIKLGDSFLNQIKQGEINYNTLSIMWNEKEKKDIIKDRLNILFFNDLNKVEKCVNIFDDIYKNVKEMMEKINELYDIFNKFYVLKYQNEIKFLNNLENKIKEGKINEFMNKETNIKLDEIYQSIPDLDDILKLNSSIFFNHLFQDKKTNNCNKLNNEEDIFKETMIDFNKIKILFEENWIKRIDKNFIKILYKIIKGI